MSIRAQPSPQWTKFGGVRSCAARKSPNWLKWRPSLGCIQPYQRRRAKCGIFYSAHWGTFPAWNGDTNSTTNAMLNATNHWEMKLSLPSTKNSVRPLRKMQGTASGGPVDGCAACGGQDRQEGSLAGRGHPQTSYFHVYYMVA